jgi:hypothetical protein
MKIAAVLVARVLTGCAAQVVPYAAKTSSGNPKSVIEQVFMEQPDKLRPDYISANDEYVEYGEGSRSRINVFSDTSSTRRHVSRLYYRSVAKDELYTKRDYVIVQFRDVHGALLARVIARDLEKGRKLIDSVATLRDKSGTTGG